MGGGDADGGLEGEMGLVDLARNHYVVGEIGYGVYEWLLIWLFREDGSRDREVMVRKAAWWQRLG